MADEITLSASLSVTKGAANTVTLASSGLTVTLAGTKWFHHIQNIGTSEEALDMGSITAPGWAYFKNLNDTDYVELRPGTGVVDMIRLNAGEFALFRLAEDVTAPFAIANSNTVNLEYFILDT